MTEAAALRAFIRDLMARFDRGMDAVVAEQRAAREESRRYFEELDLKTDEMIAEGRAGRAALFAKLDKRDSGGPTGAAG